MGNGEWGMRSVTVSGSRFQVPGSIANLKLGTLNLEPMISIATSLYTNLLGHFHLGLMQTRVGSSLREELVVAADLDDVAALDDDQPVGAAQRAETMRNGDCRAPFDQRLERGLNFAL